MSKAKKDPAKWDDCGCPKSMTIGSFVVDTTTDFPHQCTLGKDEFTKHYIFDRAAFDRTTNAPSTSPLSLWAAQRARDGRIFLAKPPSRPPLPPVPWRYDAPPLDWTLPHGWRLWTPRDPKLNFSDDNLVKDYDTNLAAFFLYMNVADGAQQKRMTPAVEAWLMACGEDDEKLVRRKHPCKSDRCFVTGDREVFAYLAGAGNKLEGFLKEFGIRRHMRRMLDIVIDAKVLPGGCGHVFNP